ncbi:MAG TPA: hypothetical protein VMS64_18115 [Candidatus Methylomirabilis sp.]|nr:hypothetical protein [Candidatus Methylomirabilis sp.]
MSVGVVYIGLLIAGVVYAVISGSLGWISDLVGDIHLDVSGHQVPGHAHPISGTIVATFVTGFGGGGIVGHYVLHWALVSGLLLAAGSGLGLAAAAFAMLELLFKHTEAGSEFGAHSLEGREADVITMIPSGGTGEIATLVRGQRETTAARASDGQAIAKGQLVVIERVSGSVAHVRVKR